MARLALHRLLSVLPLLLVLPLQAQASRTHHYKWKAEYLYWSPDCVEAVVIGINGQFPGPTIRARAGDTVLVELENALTTEGLAIHWHGIQQKGTPWSDGAVYVSQCPINPGETFTYKFVVPQEGTFLYHGHFGLQRSAGLYGSIVVLPPEGVQEPFQYDGDFDVVLSDWFHRTTYDQELGLDTIPFRWVGDAQSLLIGGRGRYNCSLIPSGAVAGSGDALSCNSTNPQCSPLVIGPVKPGGTYRLRIGSASSLQALNFVLEGHNLTLVEADGGYVEPVELSNLDLYSGQTYSVLFTANQDPSRNYWAGVNIRGRPPNTPTGLAVLQYLPKDATPPTTPPPSSPRWDDYDYSLEQAQKQVARAGYVRPVPQQADRKLVLLTSQYFVGGKFKWAINNVSFTYPKTPILPALKYKIKNAFDASPPPDVYPGLADYDVFSPPPYQNAEYGNGIYTFRLGDVVDVVIQNTNVQFPNSSDIHPWHLHGHDFWILGYGKGRYDPAKDELNYNLQNPLTRNTASSFPWGWLAIRFVADNPGVWPFHCHVESHFYMGMGVIFAEGVDQIPPLPNSILGCGLTKSLYNLA